MNKPNWFTRVYRHTIWHPDAITPDEWKYRQLKRVWLPVFDVLLIIAGMWAVTYGSPILNRIFVDDPTWVNILGTALYASAIGCSFGVAFPALWRVEIISKLVLMTLLSAYATLILLTSTPPDWFPVFVILATLPLPFFRLSLLGEEIKERRADAERESN